MTDGELTIDALKRGLAQMNAASAPGDGSVPVYCSASAFVYMFAPEFGWRRFVKLWWKWGRLPKTHEQMKAMSLAWESPHFVITNPMPNPASDTGD